MEELLKVEQLCKNQILDHVSFTVESGEMVAVMGPSGSGKSTLLYNVAGMDQPTGGKVWLNGREITGLSEDEKAGLRLQRMGFVFQQMNMMGNLNLLDNILLPAVAFHKGRKADKKSKAELTDRARMLMQKLSISGLEKRNITQVSGGQLQRACICRSMMNQPEILFADEPTGALNRTMSNEVMEELVKLNEEGTTIMMVTHDAKVAARCSRVLYIIDGNIKGEYEVPRDSELQEKDKERMLNNWLMNLGW